MAILKVAVQGATGRVGTEILSAVCNHPEMRVTGAVSLDADGSPLSLPDNSGTVPHTLDFPSLLQHVKPDVVVDFSQAEAALATARYAIGNGVHVVIGTSGLTGEQVLELDGLCRQHGVGGVIAPNFALGAVLMIHMSKIASKYFDYAEVIERHHETKIDAPSGTALATAEDMVKAKGKPFKLSVTEKVNLAGSRGAEVGGVAVHSLRPQGSVAHQEVIFGGLGQTLTIRHDTSGRLCYMPGVLMALEASPKRVGIVYGLDALLGLD